MIKVGLTGNIGSGKSLVCQVFKALGIPVFSADLEARTILNSKEVIEEIKATFGKEFVRNNHEIDRKKLATIVFNSKNKLEKLNQLIHPKLRMRFQKWVQEYQNKPYILQEAAILFENNFHHLMDKTITVSAPFDLRLKRVLERDNTSKEDVLSRMNNQWPDGKKEKLSDFVINNDGLEMLIPQILKIHQELTT